LPAATATGVTTCERAVTSIPAGSSTTVAQPMMARDSRPPKGKPMRTFMRSAPRSFTLHPSSTAPEEKKNTS
jgi:hypothetical protein